MIDELRTKISNDLQIIKFKGESIRDYNQRIIYSALSMWVRSLLNGNSINDFNGDIDKTFPDFLYVQSNLSKIAQSFLTSFECNPDWLDMNDNYNSVSMAISRTIIDEMIYLQEIGEVLERKLSPVPHRKNIYGQYVHEYGLNTFGKEFQTIGVSMWTNRLPEDKNEREVVIPIGGKEYYSYIDKSFPWITADITGTYEMFKVGSTRAYSKQWIIYNPNKIKNGIYLLKEANSYEPSYLLIKKKDKQIEMIALDSWYVTNKEICRIMYALNASNDTPARFRIREYDDYVILYYASALPDEENRLIQSISWPYSAYSDKYSRIIPRNVWNIALENIEKVGAIITK